MNMDSLQTKKPDDVTPQLKEMREKVPSLSEEPTQPSKDSEEFKAVTAQKEKERLEKIEEIRKKLGVPGTGEQLDVSQPEKTEISEDKTAEKIRIEFDKELSTSIVLLAGQVQELEENLRLDKFAPISFKPENFKVSVLDEPIDFQKVILVINELQVNLKKNFNLQNERGTVSTDPHRFNRVIDSLDRLNGVLISLRRTIDKKLVAGRELEAKKMSESLTKTINVNRKKKEDMEESQALIRRYNSRR